MSVLENKPAKSYRPYSQKELENMKNDLYKKIRLGEIMANHSSCGHFYFVKKNGRKEKEILENKSNDVGNCSVCWKLSKTPKKLKDNAYDLVEDYQHTHNNKQTLLSYYLIELLQDFYTWLYLE
jgi:hypothetical protein